MTFATSFHALTGHPPFPWQERLYEEFLAGNIPSSCNLPTGMGKTSVIAVWLLAREVRPDKLPTRLVYVVDRRTVVDQATELACKLRENCKQALNVEPPAISTLRGQLADNRTWSRDPTRSAIIIGTVDLVGSALLFAGYRSSYKRRPLEAGLLGQDSLLILDEAHLSQPFEKLIKSILTFQKRDNKDKPMRVMCMSATSDDENESNNFILESTDLVAELTNRAGYRVPNPVLDRYTAKKRLEMKTLKEKEKLPHKLADEAVDLASNEKCRGKRIVVFVRRPEDAMSIAKAIRERATESVDTSGPKPKKTKSTPFTNSVETLTGTMRGLERDELVNKSVFKDRWLNGDLDPNDPANQEPVFLISTSAGEVGFDLNADHMVCDASPIDSMFQRLGRVNRRGKGDAIIQLICDPKPADKTEMDKACIAATKLLIHGMDVSPKALLELKAKTSKDKFEAALSPKPKVVELTDILLDAWSMTSICERMPGRPDVGPWLRGIADWEQPRTEIAWRAELDLEGFAELDRDDIEEWFDTHRIQTHETLSVKTSDAAGWFVNRWNAISEAQQRKLKMRLVIVDRGGKEFIKLGEVINRLSRKASDADAFLRGAEVIVPASFGGIRRGVGLLDSAEPTLEKEEQAKTDEEHESILEAPQNEIDVADVIDRFREKLVKHHDGTVELMPLDTRAAKPATFVRFALELVSDDDKTERLVSYVPRREKVELGSTPQTLAEHVCAVRKAMDRMLSRLVLSNEIRQAAQLAADWHDHGKARERWQRLLIFRKNFIKPDEPMGKSGCEMKRDPAGYRHEFGSIRELADAYSAGTLVTDSGAPISREVFDLAMHMIATHHGRGRPHFSKGGFDPDKESSSDEIHTEAIRRFARLQRKYGWWRLAWLENLLRCADAMASEDQGTENDRANVEGGES